LAIPVNPTYNALNKRLLMFGVERGLFSATLLVAVLVFYMGSLVAALLVFAAIFVTARSLTRDDEQLVGVLIAQIRLARLYDSALRKEEK
jgi:type IV secretory pathway VirB3-like protein